MRTMTMFPWKRHMAVAALGCVALWATSVQAMAEEIRVAFSDPSKPGTVAVDLMNGKISVEGYEGREVIIDAVGEGMERQDRPRTSGKRAGLKKIGGTGGGINVEEQNNLIRISVPMFGEAKIAIRVPTNTALKLSCINGDDMLVSNVSGDLELKNINGGIKATNVTGAVVAHSLNDDVEVVLRGVAPGKPMSFSSLNGDIDVTMPASTKADFVIDTHNGEIFTDFEVALEPNVDREVSDGRAKGGALKVKVNQNLKGKVNGGGALMQFKNHNGDILIRKGA